MSQNRRVIDGEKEKNSFTVPKEISDTAKLVASMKAAAQFGGWPGRRNKPLFKHGNPLITEEDIQKIDYKPMSVKISLAVRER